MTPSILAVLALGLKIDYEKVIDYQDKSMSNVKNNAIISIIDYKRQFQPTVWYNR